MLDKMLARKITTHTKKLSNKHSLVMMNYSLRVMNSDESESGHQVKDLRP